MFIILLLDKLDYFLECYFEMLGFVNTEAGESHKFLLRPCMETLYVGLFYGFKQIMTSFVIQLVKDVTSSSELSAVVKKLTSPHSGEPNGNVKIDCFIVAQ